MKRIYFLSPNIDITKKIVDDLLILQVKERHLHILAKPGTAMETLPESGYLQKTDLTPALEQGIALGGLTGLIAGLVAVSIPGSLVLAGGAVLASSLVGARGRRRCGCINVKSVRC